MRIHWCAAAAVGLLVVFWAPSAHATTASFAAFGQTALVRDAAGAQQICGLGTAGAAIGCHPADGDGGWTRVPNPTGLLFFQDTGLSAINPSTGPGFLYAVSRAQGGFVSTLWEFSMATQTWRQMTLPNPAPNLAAPLISSVRSGSNNIIALRTTDAPHRRLWLCVYSGTAQCTWTDVTCIGGTCHYLVGQVAAMDWGGGTIVGVAEDQHVWRFNILFGWAQFADPPGGFVPTQGGIAAIAASSSDLRIVVGAHPSGGNVDRLYMLRSANSGNNWAWLRLVNANGEPSGGYGTVWQTASVAIAHTASSGSFVVAQNAAGDRLYGCVLTGTLPTTSGDVTCGSLSTTATVGFLPLPADMLAGRDLFGLSVNAGITTDGRYEAFTTGQLTSTIMYMYLMETVPDGAGARFPIWSNLMAPLSGAAAQTPITLPLPAQTSEFSGAEFYGTVALGDTLGNVALSRDDGSTWTQLGNPFAGPTNGDTSLGFDSTGALYQTILDCSGPGESCLGGPRTVAIARVAAGGPGFGGALRISPTIGTVNDRPWMVVRRDVPNFVLVTYWATSGAGAITYCSGATPCDQSGAVWCPASTPANFSCVPGSACFATQAGDGSIWFAIDGSPGGNAGMCSPSTGYRSVAVTRLTNLAALGTGCAAPVLGSPTCLYYVAEPPVAPTQQPQGITFPSSQGAWSLRIEGARDSGDIAVAIRDWQDVATAGPCTSSSAQCRPEVRVLRRFATTGVWLGPLAACGGGFLNGTCSANADQAFPQQWASHILPAITFFDYGQVATYWMDFRTGSAPLPPSSQAEYQYQYRTRQTRYAGSRLVSSYEGPGWPSLAPAGVGLPLTYVLDPATFPTDPSKNYADVDTTAAARLHTHSAHLLVSPPSGCSSPSTCRSGPPSASVVMEVTWSPRTPPR